MEKNLEKSLKRYLKRKVKITLGLVVSFLITGMVSFAEGETVKGIEKKSEVNEKLLLEELLREINLGNINIIENGQEYRGTQKIENGHIGINEGNIKPERNNIGQNVNGGTGINNGTIQIESNGYNRENYAQSVTDGLIINNNLIKVESLYSSRGYGQNINGGIGINNHKIETSTYNTYDYGQNISNGLGVNNSIISTQRGGGQFIHNNGIGINNHTISGYGNQSSDSDGIGINNNLILVTGGAGSGQTGSHNGLVINNGQISAYTGWGNGQLMYSGGVSINNGLIETRHIYGYGQYNQYTETTNVNNGIIIAERAYNVAGTSFINGIALKRDKDNNDKLVLNGVIGQAGNNENLTEKAGDFKNNFTDQTTQKEKNIFVNNLEGKNNKLNLTSNSYDEIHITTAVSKESNFTENGAVITTENNFSSLNKSTIIGYLEKDGTLIDVSGAKTIELNNSVISANGKETDTTNHTFLKPTAVKFGTGSNITLNNSTINGKIDFSENGDNTLNLNGKYNGTDKNIYKEGTQYGTYVSDVEFGTGNDNIEIKFTETKDGKEVTNYNSSYDKKGLVTLGNVNFGDGDDTLSFSFDEMKKGNFVLAGNLNFGAGTDDKIAFKSEITADTTEKGAENIVLLNNLLFNRVSNLETLQLVDSGNTFYFEGNGIELGFNGKILGGKGEDIFVVDLDKIGNYNFDGKEGIDYIQITEKYDKSKISFLEEFSKRNIEGLKLGDFENTVDIDNLLADDKVKLTHLKGGNLGDTFKVSVDKIQNISIDGGANETTGDILELTLVVDNTGNPNLFDKVENIETLKFSDVDGNKLDINNISTSNPDTLRFKNYIGGAKDDNFTVSVDNFQKLSLIDGGANGTDKGDTLKIDGYNFTNINSDGTINDTVFGKIQNIENLEFGDYTLAKLNLNNLSDDYLKNLNIKFGNYVDTITVSTEKLGKLKGLNGGNQLDRLQITNQITNEKEDFNFLAKGDGTNGVNSFEEIYFSDKGNTINVDNLAKANNEITYINGGSGEDTFITSIETLQHIKNSNLGGVIDGNTGKDTIKINDSLDNTINSENSDILDKIHNVEKLVLNETRNNILVDSLVNYYYGFGNFEEIEGIDGGTEGNTFTINGTKTEAFGVKIEGGSSVNDKLIVNTDITTDQLLNKTGIENLKLGLNKEIDYTIDFTQLKDFKNITSGNGNDIFTVSTDSIGSMKIDGGGNTADGKDILKLSGVLNNDKENSGDENLLKGISNIENLRLDNNGNTLNIDNTNGFKNIYGGDGNDTFKVSFDKLTGLTLNGGAGIDRLELQDKFDNTTDNPFTSIIRVDILRLADVTGNKVDIDKLEEFTLITGGNQGDSFIIGDSNKLGIAISGGTGNDSLVLNTSVDTSKDLGNITGIENLTFNAKDNKLSFNANNKNKFTSLSFGKDSTNNTITLANDLEGKNITFDTFSTDNIVKADSKEVGRVKTFGHTINNAGKIELTGDKSKWKFNDNTISGDTTIALNKNTLELSEKLSLGANGKLSLGDVGFVSSGKVTLENGNIKVGLSDNVTFGEGVKTLLSLESVGDIAFGSDTTLESYAFLDTVKNGNGFNITVKSWDKLLGVGATEENKLFADTYDYILKKYYNQAEDTDKTITNAFNTFGSDAIAKYIETVTNHGLSKELVLNSESGTFKSEVKGKVLIGTDETTKGNNDLTFKDISINDFEINVAEGTTNNISLNGAVTLNNGIDGSNSKGKINIALKDNNYIKIGDINFGAVKGSLDIANTSVIDTLGTITNGDVTVGIADTVGFDKVLVSSNGGVENISVTEKAEIEIKNDYAGKLSFAKGENNITLNKENYTGDINFKEGKNTFTVSENGSLKGTVAILGEENTINIKGTTNAFTVGENSSKNTITVDGKLSSLAFAGNSGKNNIIVNGTLESGIKFGDDSSYNKVTIGENGNIGKEIVFGTGAGDEFNLTSKTGEFDYNIKNADTINLNGKNKWKFGQSSTIKGDNVTVNLNDNGEIGFNIGKSGDTLVLGEGGVNPFDKTGKYTINGNIKLTFNDTFTFSSLNDKLSVNTNIFASDTSKVDIPEFMKYDNNTFSIKSAEELKAFGLNDYAYGNYEHAILNYNKAGYDGITSMLNNNSLTDISKVLNKGIDEKDHYFYSDNREIKDVATLGNINIQTSKDNQVTDKDTDIKFTNVTGNVANINFDKGTTNGLSFLDGVNISKIDGSQSDAGFDLTLGKVNFTAKEGTKVTMSNHNDTLNILSSINDISVNTGAGNDTVNILSSINGIFDGDTGENTLNIGTKVQTLSNEKSNDEIILSGEVKNFQDINLNQNAKLDSKLAITGTDNINLNGNNLFVDVDYSKVSDNKVTGHALYNKGITVNNNDGNIILGVAETSKDTFISLGEDKVSTITNKDNLLVSGSSNHDISYDGANGDIKVTVKEHFIGKEEEVKYGHLDKIYQSIYSADKVGLMAPSSTLKDKTKEESIKAQLEFYGKIYHSTPYAYTHKISKKSAELITDSLMLNDGMPDVNSWRFGGSIAGREVENSENFYGNNYYNGIDIGNTEVTAETNIYGAYAFGEYGFEEGKAVGFAVAGSKSDTDIDGSSLKGNNIFVSAYAKQDINNLSMIAGIGYQRGFYDATRSVSNAYQSMKIEKDFEDNTFVGYFGAKYRYDFGNSFYLEPKGELRLTHSIQDDIKEDNRGDLSIEVDNKDFTSIDGELGVNLGKRIATENGVLNLKVGVSVNYALLGNDEEYLTGRITGSTKDFEIISPEDEDRAKVNILLKAEYQANNGMYYDLHYKTTTDNDDYSVGFGIGYKF